MSEQEFCLRWNNHKNNLCTVLDSMLKREILVDATLSCEGKSFRVHRAVLSACSPYFEELFAETNHNVYPIIILKDVQPEELKSLIDYCYTGRVTVGQSQLGGFLKVAEILKIRGLVNHFKPAEIKSSEVVEVEPSEKPVEPVEESSWMKDSSSVPPRKRKRHYSGEYQNIPQLLHINHPIQQTVSKEPVPVESMLPNAHPNCRSVLDLSLPRTDCEIPFQPVITGVTSVYNCPPEANGFNPTGVNSPPRQQVTNHLGNLHFKPKEFAVSPRAVDLPDDFPDRTSPQDSNNCSSSDHSISHSLHSEPPSVIRDSRERSRLEPPMLSHHPNHPSHHSVRENSDDEEPEVHQRELMEGCSSMVRSGVCNVCGCFRSDLRQHMESHSGQSFQCCLCGRAYPRRKTLNQHIKRSHPGLLSESSTSGLAAR